MKKTTIIGAVLALFAIISGILYMNTREESKEGYILLEYQGESGYLKYGPDAYEDVKGEIVNGKGDITAIDSKGIPLVIFMSRYQDTDYKQVKVVADDAYEAVVTREEIETEYKVYLLVDENTYTLVVFGDPNSKRNVRNVVKMVIE